MTTPIGIFGLGLIGTALANRLSAMGHGVIGHDPAPERQASFVAGGGRGAGPDGIWASAETVILSVYDTDQVEAVLATAPAESTHLVVITSTCDPDRIAALPARCPPGMRILEAPISGASGEVTAGKALFLLGGDEATSAAAIPLLTVLQRAAHYIGPLGHGSRAKLAINLILGLNRAALAEGLVFSEKLGLDPAAMLRVAQDSAAASAVMVTKGRLMVTGDFTPEGRIRQSAKDFGLIVGAAAAKGQDLPFAATYQAMLKDCITAGEAEFDNAAILLAIRRAKPQTPRLPPLTNSPDHATSKLTQEPG